jgi:serine/threonine protein kinase
VPPCFDEIYTSPEALALAPTTTASDVFSLAATLVYLLEGKPPFEGATLHERMAAALHARTRTLVLPDLLRSALATSPAQRPAAATLLDYFCV